MAIWRASRLAKFSDGRPSFEYGLQGSRGALNLSVAGFRIYRGQVARRTDIAGQVIGGGPLDGGRTTPTLLFDNLIIQGRTNPRAWSFIAATFDNHGRDGFPVVGRRYDFRIVFGADTSVVVCRSTNFIPAAAEAGGSYPLAADPAFTYAPDIPGDFNLIGSPVQIFDPTTAQTEFTVWASITDIDASFDVASATPGAELTQNLTIRVRYREDIRAGMNVDLDGAQYLATSVREISSRRFLDCELSRAVTS